MILTGGFAGVERTDGGVEPRLGIDQTRNERSLMIMPTPGDDRLATLLQEAKSLPPARRLRLARQILESLESSGWSAMEVMEHFRTPSPAPDDATVRQWLEEHREEKYGQ